MKAIWDIFWRFLGLGLVSFGGPAAHIGYFRTTFVERLRWLDDEHYGRLVALSQFLPGPGSSQVGFALGYHRAGLAGALAAFLGFTAPSFLLMAVLAIYSRGLSDAAWLTGLVSGLKLLAVVVVADAVLGMFQAFCRQRMTVALAVGTAAGVLVLPFAWAQLGLLVVAAAIGSIQLPLTTQSEKRVTGRLQWWPLALFAAIAGTFFLVRPGTLAHDLFAPFFQAGSLVFGGGHVVLPLLQATVGDSLDSDRFLFGYAAAQAVPGPMFTLGAFLGAELHPTNPWLGALIATCGVFLPGFLLVLVLQGAWQRLSHQPRLNGAIAGINAAVVGLLMAALYQPVFVQGVSTSLDLAATLIGFTLLRFWRPPILILVLTFALFGMRYTLLP